MSYRTAFEITQRFIGARQARAVAVNPDVIEMLMLNPPAPDDDADSWGSALVNLVAWLTWLPRPRTLDARAWLDYGTPIDIRHASKGFDLVVTSRCATPPADDAPLGRDGCVGWFAGIDGEHVIVLGANEHGTVSLTRFPASQVLGVRRLS